MSDSARWRRFCFTFAGTCAVAFAGIGGFNYAVDPYAQYGTGWFEPVVQTSRHEKTRLLAEQRRVPEGLILGSSRVMKLEPEHVQRLTGRRFFNAGVNYGRPEDFLALLRWYRDTFDRWPRDVILGLDVAAFVSHPGIDARLVGHEELARQIPEAIRPTDRAQPWKELLSWQQTKNSARAVLRQVRGDREAELIESFRDDGLRIYNQREQQIRAGTYDFHAALEYNQQEYIRLFRDYEHLDSHRCRLFARLVRICLDNDVQLHVFLTPLHPDLEQHLVQHSETYAARKADVRLFLQLALTPRQIRWVDFTEIDSFAGEPQQFVDGIHPLEPNTRKMLDRLLAGSKGLPNRLSGLHPPLEDLGRGSSSPKAHAPAPRQPSLHQPHSAFRRRPLLQGEEKSLESVSSARREEKHAV